MGLHSSLRLFSACLDRWLLDWETYCMKAIAHGRRRGLRPLANRLSVSQASARTLKRDERALTKALAQVKSRKVKKA